MAAFQDDALPVLDEFCVKTREESNGVYTANSVELAAKLVSKAIDAGAKVMNGYGIKDSILKKNYE